MSMDKYAVPNELIAKLVELGVCDSEEEALEKVASGEAQDLIIKKVEQQLETVKSNNAKRSNHARRSIESYKRNK